MGSPDIALIMGSHNDWSIMSAAADLLDELGLEYHAEVVSAHRTPDRLVSFAHEAHGNGLRVIIAGAGGAAHLPGMVAAHTVVPVIGVPIPATALNGLDAMFSIAQMPKGTPVATMAIGKPGAINGAMYAAQILAGERPELFEKLSARKKKAAQTVLDNPDPRNPPA